MLKVDTASHLLPRLVCFLHTFQRARLVNVIISALEGPWWVRARGFMADNRQICHVDRLNGSLLREGGRKGKKETEAETY